MKLHLLRMYYLLTQIIIALAGAWIFCAILTVAGVFPDKEDEWGYEARTDLRNEALYSSPWFRFPYPGQ